MGAWGYNLYDSDNTLDMVGDICQYFKFPINNSQPVTQDKKNTNNDYNDDYIDNPKFFPSSLDKNGFLLNHLEKIVFVNKFNSFLKREFKKEQLVLSDSYFSNKRIDYYAKNRKALLWVILNDIISANRFFVSDFIIKNGLESIKHLSGDDAASYVDPSARLSCLNKYKKRFEDHLELVRAYKDIEDIKPCKKSKTLKI